MAKNRGVPPSERESRTKPFTVDLPASLGEVVEIAQAKFAGVALSNIGIECTDSGKLRLSIGAP